MADPPHPTVHNLTTADRGVGDGSGAAPARRRPIDAPGLGDHPQAALALTGQNHVLRLLATGASLDRVLDALCHHIEAMIDGGLCSILLLDEVGRRLRTGAAPSLPPAFVDAIDGLRIGPSAGACGTAAYRRQPVIVADAGTDPLCADFVDLTRKHEIRAVWSVPIPDLVDGRLLGTFAVYHRTPRQPDETDLALVTEAGHLAGVAIRTRHTEAALRRSEARFRAIVQNTSDLFMVLDADGRRRYVSPGVSRALGYAPELLPGERVFDLVHPDDQPRARQTLAAVTAEPGSTAGIELRVRHREKSWTWLDVSVSNRLDDPDIGGVVLNARDVTARKAAEAALHASEREAHRLAAAARRQAQELDLLHQVRTALARELELPPLLRTVVEAIAAAFGYALVSLYLVEEGLLRLQHQVGYHQVLDRIPLDGGVMGRVARTGEPALVGAPQDDPDAIWAFAGIDSEVCVPLHDAGRVVGVLNLESTAPVRLDEDDLRLMQALAEHVGVAIGRARLYVEARAREARFGALVRNAPDLITILRADGTVDYESPAVERMLGYGADELIGQNALALVHPDDLPRVGALFAEGLRKPGLNVPTDFRFRHKDGSWRWLEAVGTNLLADPAVGGIVVNSRDVTERKRTEEALRLSDRAMGAARDGIVIVDARLPDEPMVDVNPAFERMSGYARAELVGRNCRMLQGADTDPAALVRFRTAIRERRECTVTLLNYRKEGTPFWNEVYVGPVRDGAGETTHFVGIMTDVTERRQLEEQRDRQVRYAALRADVGAILAESGALDDLLRRCAEAIVHRLDAAHATVWLLDEPAQTLALAASAGTVPEPVGTAGPVPVGRFRIGRIAQDREPCLANDLARERQAGDKDWAGRAGLTSFAGYPLLVEDRLIGVVALFGRRPLAADTLEALASVAAVLAQGIDRKRVVAALRASEERFRAIVETTAEWIWETDAAGRFTYSNPSVTAILGYRPEEVLGRRWATFLEDEDRRRVEAASPALAAAEGGRQGAVVRWRHKDGGHRDLESNGVPIRDAAGEVVGWRGTDRDVTERERTAREMAHALESQRAAIAELGRLNRVKGDFVSVVSHEFRTPLTSIQGFSELIRDEDLPPAEVKEFADDINRNALRLARMIGGMLDLDRLQSGRVTLRREPVDLDAAIREVADTLRPIAPRHAVALDLDPALPLVPGDRDRLTQVVTNLLANAIKYAPDGGEIAVVGRRHGEAVRLSVRDPGIGIPADALETVFERYARVDSGPGRAIPGTGLGLPIVREIVELHGGTVWAESEPGRGTTFYVSLPLRVADGAAGDTGARAGAGAG